MSTTIESLELQVKSSTTSTIDGIKTLTSSLSMLKKATKGGLGLNSVISQIKRLDETMKNIDSSSISKLGTLANRLSKFQYVKNISIPSSIGTQLRNITNAVSTLNTTDLSGIDKLSTHLPKLQALKNINISSIGNQLKNITSAVSTLNSADLSGIGKMATALQPLNNIGKASGLQSAITQLNKLPQLAQTLNGINWSTLTSQLQQLSNALAPLANQLNTVSTAFSRLPANIRSVVSSTSSIVKANNKVSNSYMNLWAKARMAYNAVRTGSRIVASRITQSNSYIENMNLFTASMGEYAEEAQKYGEKVSEALGIDPGEWMRNQGVFNTIITGFGVASDKAYLMSQNLTQLGYDISSFFNISFDDAMSKLQSGISGELEPLRRLGYDLSVARLEQEALNLGIEKNVNDMTQAEKSQLRYYAIMTQVTKAQGDMARTLDAPANQLRVLQAQVVQCARALGNIFIPILNAVLPYAIAFVKVLRMIADEISHFFGFTLPEVDYSGLTAGSDAMGNLTNNANSATDSLKNTDKAAKKLKNNLLGIDELNLLSNNSKEDNSELDITLPKYDFFKDFASSKADKIAESLKGTVDKIITLIKDAMSEITAVISGFLLAIGTILVVTGVNIPLGVALMAIGAIGLATTIAMNWNHMSDRLAKTLTMITGLLGGFLLAIGAFLVFSGVNIPLGAGLMVAGAISLATAATINWRFLEGDLSNALSILTAIVGGALLAMGALFAFTGVDAPLGIALMVAGAVSLATAIGLNWKAMPESIRKVIGTLEAIVGGALLTFGAILALTGVNLPLGIAMIAAGAISFVSVVALNWGALTGDLKKSISTITAIVSGALIGIGAILALTGVATPLGITMIAAGAVGIVATASLNWKAITSIIGKVLKEIGLAIAYALLAVGAILALSGVAIPLGIALIAASAVSFASSVALNWDSIIGKIKKTLKEIGIIAGANMLAIGIILCLTGVGIPLGVALIAAGAASLVSGVVLNWDTFKKKISEGFKSITDIFKKSPGEIVEGFKKGIIEKSNECREAVSTWADNIGKWFKEKLGIHSPSTVFYNYGINTTQGFNNGVSNNRGNSERSISTWAENIKSWFTKKVNNSSFEKFASNAIEGFKTKINTSYTNTKLGMTTWASKVKEWFTNGSFGNVNSNTFSNFANNTIEGFKTKINTSYTNTKLGMTTWASGVKSWFSGIASNSAFGEFATDVINGFKNGISNNYTVSKSDVTTWGSKIKEWFKSNCSWSSFYDIASDVISGFSAGIGNLYDTCQNTITSWGDSIIEWFRNTLSINSPSKVFYEMGSYTVKGFNNAIQNEGKSTKNTLRRWFNSFDKITPTIPISRIMSTQIPASKLTLAVDTSALSYDSNYFEKNIDTEMSRNYNFTSEGFEDSLEKFYKEYIEPIFKQMADDIRKQADKEEQTIVQIGNRTVTDAVEIQKNANGYRFIK